MKLYVRRFNFSYDQMHYVGFLDRRVVHATYWLRYTVNLKIDTYYSYSVI